MVTSLRTTPKSNLVTGAGPDAGARAHAEPNDTTPLKTARPAGASPPTTGTGQPIERGKEPQGPEPVQLKLQEQIAFRPNTENTTTSASAATTRSRRTGNIDPIIGTITDEQDHIGNENPVKRAVRPKEPAEPKPEADSKQRARQTQRHERDNEHRVTTAAGGTAESTAAARRTRSADTNARDQLRHENIPKRTPRRKHRLNQDHEPTPATRRWPTPRIPRPNQQTTPTAARSVRQRFISPDHRSTR